MTLTKSHSSHSPQPWIEKYRPKTINDIASQTEVTSLLKRSIQMGNLPHLLFYGPPGTGKTSTILALARDLFGDYFRERVLELNASDERGINVIRQKVKDFAKTVVSVTPNRSLASSQSDSSTSIATLSASLPSFKLVILDEADSMTYEAQAALRRTMENYSSTTRFCIICNYVHRIIDPLSSRCAKFRFKPVEDTFAIDRLLYICDQENIHCSEEVLKKLLIFTDGDLRKSINILQSCYRLTNSGELGPKGEITMKIMNELTGNIPDDLVNDLLGSYSKGYDISLVIIDKIIQEGYSVPQLLYQMQEKIIMDASLSNIQRSLIAIKLATQLKACLEGADGQLQLMALSASMHRVLHMKENASIDLVHF